MSRNENATAPQAGYVCRACHSPVTATLRRYKAMGIFVPLWRPGPCQNPSCPKYRQEEHNLSHKSEAHA